MRIPHAVRVLLAAVLLCLSFPLLAAIALAPVVSSGLSSPVFVGNAKDGSSRLFIVEQTGVIRVLQSGASVPTAFLDIHTRIAAGGERGLLGLTFHPQYAANGRFYVYYTRAGDGAIVIAQYAVSADANIADPTETGLLVIPHPTNANHNGGMMAFGPDGYLYIGVGDGGSGNDPPNNAQNTGLLLGKILRIDVDHPDPAAGTLYSAPPDNPFVNGIGRDEIFALGMRNPWRFSFDRVTGQQWVGDVGQGAREEVDTPIVKGGNYGWRVYEGTLCTNLDPALCNPANYVFPIFDYAHTGGRCSITGGYVYRGLQSTLPAGTYIYGDYCSGEIFTWNGSTQVVALDTTMNISSFGEDEQGELYVVNLGGTISKIVATTGPTTTTLASSANPAPVGTTITFTATITGANPSGSVSFAADGTTLAACGTVGLAGTGNTGTAACNTRTLAAGTHAIVARYSGDANNAPSSSASLSQVVTDSLSTALVNGSFETPALGTGFLYAPSGPGVAWVFSGSAGIQANGSAWNAAPAPVGRQTAFVQNLGRTAQTITLNAGNYMLSFKAARRASSNPPGSVQPIRLTVDGQQISSLVSPAGTSFSTFTIAFTVATTGAHTIQFAGTDGSGDKSTFIDAVGISPAVPQFSNAGFEVPTLANAAFQYVPTATGVAWAFGPGAGIQSNGSAWGAAAAPEGRQTAFVQNHGTIAQTITLNAGNFMLSFKAARRASSNPPGSVQPIRVTVDAQQIGGLVSPPTTGFSEFTIAFSIATTGAHTLQFSGTDNSGDKSSFIDLVILR